MDQIYQLLHKIRIFNPPREGQADWESLDLLGDRNVATIHWFENGLTVNKCIEVNGVLETSFTVCLEVSQKGRLLLKESSGLSPEWNANKVFQHVRQDLQTGAAPIIRGVSPPKGFTL